MTEALQKEIINRVKRIKCGQPDCKSQKQETLEVGVINQSAKRKGIMCTSCFIDQQLLANLGNVELNAISIQKFLKVLTENYELYAAQKAKPSWPPTLISQEKERIQEKVRELERTVSRGIMQMMKYLDDSINDSVQQAKKVNFNKSVEKLYDLIHEEDEVQQDRMNVTDQIKDIVKQLVNDHGQYKLSSDQKIRKQNQEIILKFHKKLNKTKQTILQLVEVHKKCLKHLIE